MDAGSSYREAAVRGATPVQLVICLYEQAIADVRRAILALEIGDIQARTRGINHALKVIGHLHGSLDKDRGGEVARNLERFYSLVRTGLIEAQMKESRKVLEEQVSLITMVHEAWLEVERVTAAPGPRPAGLVQTGLVNPTPETASADWNA
jgi:flagellar secretion chaperone FliS